MTDIETLAYQTLRLHGIPYERYEHEAATTMAICDKLIDLTNAIYCKNLFLTNRAQTNVYLVLMSPHKRFRTANISKQLGVSRLSFATDDMLMQYMGLMPGSVTPLGLIHDTAHRIVVAIDDDLLKNDYICIHPMVNTASVKILTADLLRFIRELSYDPILIHPADDNE